MEELDLDSILLAHGGDLSSDDDSTPSTNFRHRTIEEILNDSDNSSTTSQTLTILNNSNLEPLKFKSHISETSVLPSLFGSVKPNPKPGAALAAAVAAARHVPTMYTERIKSRKASDSELAQKAETSETFQDFETDSRSELNVVSSIDEEIEVCEELVENNKNLNLVDSSSGSGIFVNTQEMQSKDEVEIENQEVTEIENQEVTESKNQEANGIINDEEDDRISNQDLDKFSNYEIDDSEIQDVTMGANIAEVEDDSENESSDTEDLYEGLELVDEIDESVEERLEPVQKNNGTEEKPPTSMKPLEQAELLEKKNASYGLHWEEGAAAQPMRLEGIRRGPPAVGYIQIDLDNTVTRTISSQLFRRDYGLPQVVAVHMNYIGIGASKGAVLVFPSKYSAYSVDHVDLKMLVFNSNGAKSQASVTSMCFNQQGDLLLVGYGDGSMTLWDVQKAAIARVMNGEHSAPVVHALFLGQFTAITGDSKGIVFQHTISVFPLLNHFSVKSKVLLDGKKNGTVLSIRPHIIDGSHSSSYNSTQVNSTQSTSGLGSMVGGVVNNETGWKLFNEGSSLAEEGVVIFATHKNLLVIRLTPTTAFYDTISKPDGVREGSMPYIAWRCTTYSDDSSSDASDKTTWLVNAWDHRVQVMQLVKSKLKILKEWSLDSMAIGAAWLDDQMLVVLTVGGQLCLFSKDGTELHRTSFAVNGSSLDDIISYHTHINNTFGNPEKAYHNSVCVRGATVYLLGPMHLLTSRLLPWKEHIQVLQRAGDWMGALDMAMRLYDGQAQGVIDLPKSVENIRETIMEYSVELLKSYVDEVFSYISVAFCNQIGKVEQSKDTISPDSSVRSEIEEQYARVGGVAVEFCVHIKRIDILFNNIYSKFESVKHGGSGVTTDIQTSYATRIMNLSVLPFVIVQLPRIFRFPSGQRLMVLLSFIASVLLVISYCLYQVFQPWIRKRRLAYAKHKHVISGILRHAQKEALGKLLNDEGEPNVPAIRKLFRRIDLDSSNSLSQSELRTFIIGIQFDEIDLDKDDAVERVMKDFDRSRNEDVDEAEFIAGMSRWIQEAKKTVGKSDSYSKKFVHDFHLKMKEEHNMLIDKSDETVETVENAKWVIIKAVLLLVLGTVMAVVFADPLVDAVHNFSIATKIPSFFISFIAMPLATNSSEAVSALIFASRKKQRTSSLTFSEDLASQLISKLAILQGSWLYPFFLS